MISSPQQPGITRLFKVARIVFRLLSLIISFLVSLRKIRVKIAARTAKPPPTKKLRVKLNKSFIKPLKKDPSAHPSDIAVFKSPMFLPFSVFEDISETQPKRLGGYAEIITPQIPMINIKYTGKLIKGIIKSAMAEPVKLKIRKGFLVPRISANEPIITVVAELMPKDTPNIKLICIKVAPIEIA